MARSTRNSKARSAKTKTSKVTKDRSEEATAVMKPRDDNVDTHRSSLLSSSDEAEKTHVASKGCNRRPPLPRGKITKKTSKKEGGEKEAMVSDDETSPLKKKNLLGRATTALAIAASTQGRPRRRAAASTKKQYVDIDSATDGETSSSDESGYGSEKKSRAKCPVVRKSNKRKKGAPASRKSSNAKRAKMKMPSPQASTKAGAAASPAAKNSKGSPFVTSTPQGASIGLTPIKDSVSKVWKNEGGDWRVLGAIDYGFD